LLSFLYFVIEPGENLTAALFALNAGSIGCSWGWIVRGTLLARADEVIE